MAIYVDFMQIEFKGYKWCHMLADTLQELHDFAALIEVDKRLFHRNASYPHYDVTVQMREIAIEYGAIPAGRKKIIECAKKLKVVDRIPGVERLAIARNCRGEKSVASSTTTWFRNSLTSGTRT